MRICGDRYILTFAGRPPSSDGTLAHGPVAGGWNSGSISASVSSVSGRGFEVRRLLAVTILFLAGCGPRLPPPGAGTNNYLRDAPESLERVMAIESVDILETLYDPHTTGFHLLRPRRDAFGANMDSELRSRGYAVAVGGVPPDGLRLLRYTIEGADDEYTLTMTVDGKLAKAMFGCDGDRCLPMSGWMLDGNLGEPPGHW